MGDMKKTLDNVQGVSLENIVNQIMLKSHTGSDTSTHLAN